MVKENYKHEGFRGDEAEDHPPLLASKLKKVYTPTAKSSVCRV